MTTQRFFICAWVVMLTVAFTLAQPINYQGRLLDSAGAPITASTSVRFTIYEGGDAATAGSGALIYSETTSVDPDATGIFSYQIGETPDPTYALTPDLFQTDAPLYLQINVPSGGDVLLPRSTLVSVPRALTADALSPEETVITIPVIGASVLFGGTADPSDDQSDVYGIRVDDANNQIVADGLLPLSWTGEIPDSISVTAEILLTLPPSGQRSVVLSFRMHGTESGAQWTFEDTHEFTGTGPEIIELPRVVANGTFIPGEVVSWTYQRRYNMPADTLSRQLLFLGAQMKLMTTR